jgi:D-glycero-alpha-D-manno-heptose-7-phosphate kinase
LKKVESKVPLRVSFVGGGSDVEPFVSRHGGRVIAATINHYVTVTVEETDSEGVSIHSIDTNQSLILEAETPDVGLFGGILTACLTKIPIQARKGFSITVNSPVPPKSGLGSSSAIILAILGGLYKYFEVNFTRDSLAVDAFEIERHLLNIPGGCQDQYVCAIGGINKFSFSGYKKAEFLPIEVSEETRKHFEESAFLVWTGISRNSNIVLEDQISRNESGQNTEALEEQKQLTDIVGELFREGNFRELGQILSNSWGIKRKFTNFISSDEIDLVYALGMEFGAFGGKLLGAGGGGFFLFLFDKSEVDDAIRKFNFAGYEVRRFEVTDRGVEVRILSA